MSSYKKNPLRSLNQSESIYKNAHNKVSFWNKSINDIHEVD